MKIVFVCRWHGTHAAAFIDEQKQALESLGHEVRYITAKKGGVGYIQLYCDLWHCIRSWQPDIVHAHYGICGLVANLQRRVPVVTTYPGSDINDAKIRPISKLCIRLSAYNLFMSQRQMAKVSDVLTTDNNRILRYGIMIENFVEMEKAEARERMHLPQNEKLVLFSSKFSRLGKDPDLALAVCRKTGARLLELTGGYTKEEMCWLMNAVDAAIVTSKSEGSPQFTKEVMACGCPIVSVDVGDVAEQVEGLGGCYISKTREVEELADLLTKAMAYEKTKGHEHILKMQLSNEQVAKELVKIYDKKRFI